MSESQLPEGRRLLLCISTGERFWPRKHSGLAALRDWGQPKERRRKAGQRERSSREGHEVKARPVKTFRSVSDIKNDTANLPTKSDLRDKRRDPWHGANAPSKAVADLVLSGQDAESKSQTCLDLVREPVAQPPVGAS